MVLKKELVLSSKQRAVHRKRAARFWSLLPGGPGLDLHSHNFLCDLGQSIYTSLLPFLFIDKMGVIIFHKVVAGIKKQVEGLRKCQGPL